MQGETLSLTIAGLRDKILGFSDGVIGMARGGKRTMFIPPDFGFGSKGNNKVPPNSPLVIGEHHGM